MRRHALDGCPARQKTRKRSHKHQVYFDLSDSPMSTVSMPNLPMEPQALWA